MIKTITNKEKAELNVEKSRFISFLFPITLEDEVKPILENIRKENFKARHVCYAYKIDNKSKSCDDGEPSGTAGAPILELLNKVELNDVLLVVVRYFGGIKLGAGRLLRTYVEAGKVVINKVAYGEIKYYQGLSCKCSYSNYEKIKKIESLIIEKVSYEEEVKIEIFFKEEDKENILSLVEKENCKSLP